MCVHRLLKSSIVCGQIRAAVCVYLCTCWDASNNAASVIFLILFNCEPTLFNQPTGFPLRRTVQLSSSTCWFSHHAAGFLGTVSRWIELESSCTVYWFKMYVHTTSTTTTTTTVFLSLRPQCFIKFLTDWLLKMISINSDPGFKAPSIILSCLE